MCTSGITLTWNKRWSLYRKLSTAYAQLVLIIIYLKVPKLKVSAILSMKLNVDIFIFSCLQYLFLNQSCLDLITLAPYWERRLPGKILNSFRSLAKSYSCPQVLRNAAFWNLRSAENLFLLVWQANLKHTDSLGLLTNGTILRKIYHQVHVCISKLFYFYSWKETKLPLLGTQQSVARECHMSDAHLMPWRGSVKFWFVCGCKYI